MSTSDDETPPTREDLLRARKDLRRQLQILRHPFRFGRSRSREAKLESMVKEIDECMTAMEKEGASE